MRKNNYGFALRELLIILAFFAIIFAFGSYSAFKGGSKRKYEVFAQNARDFVTKVSTYRDEYNRYADVIYLEELVNTNYIKAFKNPFSGGGNCDLYESKVVLVSTSEKYVTLRCGNYLIDSQLSSSGNYKVYKVSDWEEEFGDALEAETAKLYNYEKNGKVVLDNYVMEKELITLYNEKENKNTKKIDNINSKEYKVITKTFYRTKKLVRENL